MLYALLPVVPLIIGLSSKGIGGSYAHVIVEEVLPPPPPQPISYQGPFLLPLSAASPDHFKLYGEILAGGVEKISNKQQQQQKEEATTLLDICGTMGAHRSFLQYRKSMVVRNRAELMEKLGLIGEGKMVPMKASESIGHRPLFVFTGQVGGVRVMMIASPT